MATRYTGKVKSFSTETYYGFVQCPKVYEQYGEDVYLHGKSLEFSGVDPSMVEAGTVISFEIFMSPKGHPQANEVKILTSSTGGATPQFVKGGGATDWDRDSRGHRGGDRDWKGHKGDSKGHKGDSKGHKGESKGHKGESNWHKGGDREWNRPEGEDRGWKAGGGGDKGFANSGDSRGSWNPPPALKAAKGKAGIALPNVAGKGEKAPKRAAVEASKVEKAVKKAAGDLASATLSSSFAKDGSPMVEISLTTLNFLLTASGHDVVEGSQAIPTGKEALPGYSGGKVEGPWYIGTIKRYFPDEAYGFIESAAFKEQFGDKECFVHADHLALEDGKLIAQEGDEVIFPLVEDEEGNAWAWAPVVPRSRDFLGTIKSWSGGYGFIKCDTLFPIFEIDIYLHGQAAEHGGCNTEVGCPIVFNLHVNKEGKPQASHPRPPGTAPVPRASGERSTGAGGQKTTERPWDKKPEAKRPRTSNWGATLSDEEKEKWHHGTIKAFNTEKGFGFIDCPELHAVYDRDVFIHNKVYDGTGAEMGSEVAFKIDLNAEGQPQAVTCTTDMGVLSTGPDGEEQENQRE